MKKETKKYLRFWTPIWFCCSGLGAITTNTILNGFGIAEAIFFSFIGGYLFAVFWLYPLWRTGKNL